MERLLCTMSCLVEVLCQPWWLLTEALERSGFNEIQDVLLMNQAERDMQTFLNANGVITPLPQVEKNKLLDVKPLQFIL